MLALTLILGTSIVLPVTLPFACGSSGGRSTRVSVCSRVCRGWESGVASRSSSTGDRIHRRRVALCFEGKAAFVRHVRHRNGAVSAERSACVKSPRLARCPAPRSCSPASRGRADRAAAHAGGMNGGVCRWGGIGKSRLTMRVWRR